MLDIRYHIASLTAVFLALGFGILIGSSFTGPAALSQMKMQIQRQNQRLDDAVALNEQDHTLLHQNEDAIEALIPRLVQNQLAGKRVVLIQTGDYPEAVQDASQAITQAGGTVSATIALTAHFDMLSDDDRQGLAKALGAASSDNSNLLRPVAVAIAAGTANHPNVASQIADLAQASVIDMSGDLSAPANMVVLVGGSETEPDSDSDPDLPPGHDDEIISLLRAVVAPQAKPPAIVGCETRDAVQSSIPVYLRAGIASVDCIDQPLGALDLPFALNGDNSAFGLKPTADRLVPQTLSTPPATAATQSQAASNPPLNSALTGHTLIAAKPGPAFCLAPLSLNSERGRG